MSTRILCAVVLFALSVSFVSRTAYAQDPCSSPIGASDPADVVWSFDSGAEGWTTEGGFSSTGVQDGCWRGVTSSSPATLVSPGGLLIPGSYQGYVSVTMRLKSTSPDNPHFGKTSNYIYYNIDNPGFEGFRETRRALLKGWGNGEWKTANIWFGQAWYWVNHVVQFKIQMNVPAGTLVEIACVKVKRDLTPPAFRIETRWNPSDGQTIVDTTPSVSLEDYYDDVSYLNQIEFYYRPSSDPREEAWVLDGSDANQADGLSHTYSGLAPGTYDFGVKASDKAGNVASWNTGPDRWLQGVTINPSAPLAISVDAADAREPVNKKLFGNNLEWNAFNLNASELIFDPSTDRLPSSVETMLQEIAPTVLRYPGGCLADTFYWKDSIGYPAFTRPVHYATVCAMLSNFTGPALFGLDEFLTFCQARDFEPMLTCRFRWPAGPEWPAGPGFPEKDGPDPFAQALADAADLVEYCNTPNNGSNPNGGTNWAAVRAQNGHPLPYGVRLFEIGNEPYGPDMWGSPGRYISDPAVARTCHAVTSRRFLDAMKAVDPTISVSVPSRFGEGDLKVDQTTINYQIELLQQAGQFADHLAALPVNPRPITLRVSSSSPSLSFTSNAAP